jgi:2-haloacid dehalogenase
MPGSKSELARLFGAEHAARLLVRYHGLEPRVQREHLWACYRDVMAAVLAELASEAGRRLAREDVDVLGRSLPAWPVFPEVSGQLEEAHRRALQLVILSNSDRDLIDASIEAIGVPFKLAVVASEVGSYKPAPGHWRAFYDPRRPRAPRARRAKPLPRHRPRVRVGHPLGLDKPLGRASAAGPHP